MKNNKIKLAGILFLGIMNSLICREAWADDLHLPVKADVIASMELVNQYWISQNPDPGNNQWARAVYFVGNMDFYKVYPKEEYLQYSNLWANKWNWGLNGGVSTRHADNHICGQVYIDLYNRDQTKDFAKINAIKTSIDRMVDSEEIDDWWWIDAYFMAMPVFARLGTLYNDNTYFEKMHALHNDTKNRRRLYNATTHLWYRDENHDPPEKTPNNKDIHWSRGNGWVIAAYARVLQLLPQNNVYRNEYTRIFHDMAVALIQRQRTDGFWNVSLDDPDDYGGIETSGTALFTYALAWGINNNILERNTYLPAVKKAWEGLTQVAVQENGFLAYVQNVGLAPASSQPVTIQSTADFGVGAFLLAGSEVVKLASGEMPLPSNDRYVRASGTEILDPEGNRLIFRGIGTGNWMLQEGYMMGTSGATNGTQWDFRRKLVNTIGEEKTKEFYTAWWNNHFRRIDVDSMAAWGFNMVRVAMHYKIFTLPVEDEPQAGVDTWLEEGFVLIDSLLKRCADNRMYLILDMHGCPGGQGDDSNISDYDSSKPSLWESEENKRKLVALWKKLAERYATSPWIGGYDLINEPKWTLPNNNKDLWDLYKLITAAIREIDKNHLLIIEGNNWGNDYNGLPALWDGNMGLSFHKYWNYNSDSAIDWIVNMGRDRNCPVWLGETGENSNTWFADVIRLCESKNVGWSFWPVKKTGMNNILRSKSNNSYGQLLNAWRNNTSIDVSTAYNGVMQFAADHRLENCDIRYDVIDAMTKRPYSNETRPFKNHTLTSTVFAVDYDLGPAGYAYLDNNDADYHGSGESYTGWNQGGAYRNDGVDIESNNKDNISNGYHVGWVEDGEWLCYTIKSTENKSYTMEFRYSSQSGGAKLHVEINGKIASKTIILPSTGAWNRWSSIDIPNIIIPPGDVKVKFVFEKGGVNFNYFKWNFPGEAENVPFELLSANTDKIKDKITLNFNLPVSEVNTTSFTVKIDNVTAEVGAVKKNDANTNELTLTVNKPLLYNRTIQLSYNSATCKSDQKPLLTFSDFVVTNHIAQHTVLPAKVEAEDYAFKSGFTFQICSDAGGGENAGYTEPGNYLDYILLAGYTGDHEINLRVAVNENTTRRIGIYRVENESVQLLKDVSLPYTGGWQNWATQTATIKLKQSKNVLRIFAVTGGFNLNWFEIKEIEGAGIRNSGQKSPVMIYPNPVSDVLYVNAPPQSNVQIILSDLSGKEIYREKYLVPNIELNIKAIPPGIYLVKVITNTNLLMEKIIKRC